MVLTKQTIKILWLLLGVVLVVLFCAAMQMQSHRICKGIQIKILGLEDERLVGEKDILGIINAVNPVENKRISDINLQDIETEIEKNAWIKNAELYFDNKQILKVKVEERQAIARVFTQDGSSFYLDTSATRMPLSQTQSPRVPMFSNFPSNRKVLSVPDSLLLRSVVNIGKYILMDSFWKAQVAQVFITPQATFEIIPNFGNHVVTFGDGSDIDGKFNRLLAFYKQAWLQSGINTYKRLDVQYQNQIVAVKSEAAMLGDTAAARKKINALMKGNLVVSEDSSNLVSVVNPDSVEVKPAPIKPSKTESKKKYLEKTSGLNNKVTKKSFFIRRKLVNAPKKTKPHGKR